MPTVDLTPRLARQSKPGDKDTILFDRSLPGFGLRIHSSGRKVYIVQARIEGRSRRLPRPAAAPATCSGVSARARTPPTTSAGRRRPRRCRSSPGSTCGAPTRTGSRRGARPCASTSRPASCPPSTGCRSTALARKTWPRGSTRRICPSSASCSGTGAIARRGGLRPPCRCVPRRGGGAGRKPHRESHERVTRAATRAGRRVSVPMCTVAAGDEAQQALAIGRQFPPRWRAGVAAALTRVHLAQNTRKRH